MQNMHLDDPTQAKRQADIASVHVKHYTTLCLEIAANNNK